MKSKLFILSMAFILILTGCSSESQNAGNFESETAAETESTVQTVSETESETLSETVSEESIFPEVPKQEYTYTNVCDEGKIADVSDYLSPVNAKALLTDESFTEEILNELPLLEVNKKSLIHGLDEIYISCVGVNTFSLNQNAVIPQIQCFVFNSSLENIGTVDFIENEGYNLNIFVTDESGNTEYSEIFGILSEEKDKKYAFVSFGIFGNALIDEENNVKYIGENIDKDLEIIGNPYGIFDEKGLVISYDDIVNEENLIKFEIKELG